jgi:hypothetical protein
MSKRKVKPLFSPDLQPEVRELLADHRRALVPASEPTPKRQVDLRDSTGRALFAIAFAGAIDFILWRWATEFLYAVAPAGLAVWLSVAAGVFFGLMFLSVVRDKVREPPERVAAREHHGQYLLPEDWDEEATELMIRAQAAVRAVQKSEVNKEGLLDAVKNEVVLPGQLWDLGRVLQQQSVLRRRQAELGKGIEDTQLDQILGPQRKALKVSAAAMEAKVERLEKYAEQVRTADAVLRVETAAATAAEDNDRYVELLATTEVVDGNDLIEQLTKESADVHSELTRSLAAALEAGQTLALPGEADTEIGRSPDSPT